MLIVCSNIKISIQLGIKKLYLDTNMGYFSILLQIQLCHFAPCAQHEKPKMGHKTQKILIVGEYKYQESIQRHQKLYLGT